MRTLEGMDDATKKLQKIYPDLNEDELEEVREFFERYLRLVIEIYSYSQANKRVDSRQD